ncbi:MAG: hypothetical protein J7604_23550 [Sporocytophaga sp.]|uniref:hypothetical protein n=1 Tax=Sporocytophaga TaxID=1011 RepID=UPI000428021A|nr:MULTISPECIES: hypothetical protein [Sporocytophaga]MBO9703210.1 hypothetical protein [Sporocytophaga sp.]
MAFFYFGIGIYFIVYHKTIQLLSPQMNIGLGALLILYGGFRGYRAFKDREE